MDLTNEQRALLKGKGYISAKDGIHFSCRVVVSAGKLTAVQAQKMAKICEVYGRGYFTLTQRGNVQIPWLRHEDLGEVPHAIIEVANAQAFAVPGMVAHLRAHLAPYKLPASLEIVETGLKDDAGKARRVAVRDERRAWVAQGRHLDRFIAVHHA